MDAERTTVIAGAESLSVLDVELLAAGEDADRVKQQGGKFVFRESSQPCSTQEALFHYFDMPVEVIATPRTWYWYHRKPCIVEVSRDRRRVLVRFSNSNQNRGNHDRRPHKPN